MNKSTEFGPVRDIASLALDLIYELRYHCDLVVVEKYEDRWLELVRTPGGSHFPSRSSSSSRVDS